MDLSSLDLKSLYGAVDVLGHEQQAKRWFNDPVLWTQERLGEFVWSKQAEVMRAVAEHPRVAVKSCHGVGKSHAAARLVAWFLDTRMGSDVFVVTTAPTNDQVRSVLWRYIADTHDLHELPGRVTQDAQWKINNKLVAYGRKPADHAESAFQGLHATHLLIILDEAGGIPAQLWNAARSMATGGEDNHILAIGNPDSNSSHFYTVHTQEAGWHKMSISAMDSPNVTGEEVPETVAKNLVSLEYIEQGAQVWGVDSPLYRCKVLGEFSDDQAGLIPMSWVVAANQRWSDWNESRDRALTGRCVVGVDVAGEGDDKTVIAVRKGNVVTDMDAYEGLDTIEIARKVETLLRRNSPSVAVVDGIGIGVGVVDTLRWRGVNVRPFIANAKTSMTDTTNTQKFPNKRSAAWWNLRELLDPALDATLALPPSDDLMRDLTVPKWDSTTGGKIKVESKDDIRKRLKRSTDFGDAVVMSLFTEKFERERGSASGRPALAPLQYAHAPARTRSDMEPKFGYDVSSIRRR